MKKVLILYYSKTGSVERMAHIIHEELLNNKINCDICRFGTILTSSLENYDGIIIGCPTYFGLPPAEVKSFFDSSSSIHGKLINKIGMAFTSSDNIGGGNELTLISVLNFFLIHGMIVQGLLHGDHYGPVSISHPDERSINECKQLAKNMARLLNE